MDDLRSGDVNEVGSGATGTVLVCDYVGRRTEAPISSLGLEAYGFTVHYLLSSPFPRELTAAAYTDELLRRHGPFDGDVRAVLAYCMAAPIGQEVAAAVSSADSRVPLVLFDGEPATASSVQQQYLLAADKMGELLSLDHADRTPSAIKPAMLSDRPQEVLRHIQEGLLELGDRAIRRGDLDAQVIRVEAAMLASYYVDWLSHLIAAYNASWSSWDGPAVQIVSREHACADEWPGASSTDVIRVPTTRQELLRHPDVAPIVLSILNKERSRA
ncbi:hypothetical protein ACLQ24_08070 [Micromonospora sp. DT4]|uniref:hypothetical protein n=1 Tax=Micromonospora sp. DT4 TaxID=3393438 RepID=UPI003CEB29D0